MLQYTIGKASKLTNLSIKTLRYYDEIGLVTPIKRDDLSNYRYYSQDQLLALDLIRYLSNDLSVPLSDIKAFLQKNGGNQNELIKYLEIKEKELDEKINKLDQTKAYLRKKIDRIKKNQKVLLNTPFIMQFQERKYYLQTTNTSTSHSQILNEILNFFTIFRPKEDSKMCVFFFTDMKDTSSSWENNSIAILTDEERNSPSFLLPKGDYIILPFIFTDESFENVLKILKEYIEEHHFNVDNKFYLIIDTIDGAAAWNTLGYLFELQVYIHLI